MKRILGVTAVLLTATLFAVRSAPAGEGHAHPAGKADTKAAKGTITVTGEVLDVACYVAHGGEGGKHAACATTCIEGGLPVGLKAADGKTYLLMGNHEALNKELAPLAARTITVRGRASSRDGFHVITDAEIVSAPKTEKQAGGGSN